MLQTRLPPFKSCWWLINLHALWLSLPCLLPCPQFLHWPLISFRMCLTPHLLVYSVSLANPDFLCQSSPLLKTNSLQTSLFCPPVSPVPLSLILHPTHTDTHSSLSLSCLSELAQAQLSQGFESQWERLGQSVLFTPSDVLKRWRDQTPLLYHCISLLLHTYTHTQS